MDEEILKILKIDDKFRELKEKERAALEGERRAQEQARQSQEQARRYEEQARQSQEQLRREEAENKRFKEDMALWMLRKNSPIEEISLITRLDRQRISEIADSAGFQAAAM